MTESNQFLFLNILPPTTVLFFSPGACPTSPSVFATAVLARLLPVRLDKALFIPFAAFAALDFEVVVDVVAFDLFIVLDLTEFEASLTVSVVVVMVVALIDPLAAVPGLEICSSGLAGREKGLVVVIVGFFEVCRDTGRTVLAFLGDDVLKAATSRGTEGLDVKSEAADFIGDKYFMGEVDFNGEIGPVRAMTVGKREFDDFGDKTVDKGRVCVLVTVFVFVFIRFFGLLRLSTILSFSLSDAAITSLFYY